MYDVGFPDREVKEYSANLIAENLLSQVDDEGFTLTVLTAYLNIQKMKVPLKRNTFTFEHAPEPDA